MRSSLHRFVFILSFAIACGTSGNSSHQDTQEMSENTPGTKLPTTTTPEQTSPATEEKDAPPKCRPWETDWSIDARIELGFDRANIYCVDEMELRELENEGYRHAQKWPVEISGLFIPYRSFARFLDKNNASLRIKAVRALTGWVNDFESEDDLYRWLGLPEYNVGESALPYNVSRPANQPSYLPMGAGVIDTELGEGLTFSCASCHAGRFLGKTVMGLQNRQPRANKFFEKAKSMLPLLWGNGYAWITQATAGEEEMLKRAKDNAKSIGAKTPVNLGLDTSLAQVALSLSLREDDPYANYSEYYQNSPRPNELETLVSDSKPMPWWTLKYKTRWLADGSVVQGNPILTNFLWNELGRGTDLHLLETWLSENQHIVDAITAAVFAAPAPKWTDFFAAETIDLAAAKRGKEEFDTRCASCHGNYDKGWEETDTNGLSRSDLIATTRVWYHEVTPVYDVDTDPARAEGMAHFAEALNGLAISKAMKTIVEVQDGYVPPPLEGIFLRYPYLHNSSVPNLCALLSPAAERPSEFYQGPSESVETDYDVDCVGYPTGDAIPSSWKNIEDGRVDTTHPGVSNRGHDHMLGEFGGRPALTQETRRDLIEYLKTL